MMGALDWLQRKLIVATSRTKRSADFIALLVTLDHLYGPKPGVATKPVVIVLDNGPVHVSKATSAALAARAHWLTVEWLPKYAPELNDIEVVWHDLKAFNLAHKTFTDVDTLDAAIHSAVADLNTERNRDLLGKQRISASSHHVSRRSGQQPERHAISRKVVPERCDQRIVGLLRAYEHPPTSARCFEDNLLQNSF